MLSFRTGTRRLSLAQTFLLLICIARFGMFRHFFGTWTVIAQHPSCSRVTSHALFEGEGCCFSPLNRCRDEEFCLGVAIAAKEDTELECCEAYESCIGTHDMFHALNIFKGLTIGDLVVSTLIMLFTLFKTLMICSCCGEDDDSTENQGSVARAKWCAKACIGLELIDLVLEISIVAVTLTGSSRDFVAELRSAGCFNGWEETSTIGDLSGLFESYFIVAIIEAVADILAIILHFFELHDIGREESNDIPSILAGIADAAELALAIFNLTLILQIIADSTTLHDTMNHFEGRGTSGACVYNCCIERTIMVPPTPPPTRTPSNYPTQDPSLTPSITITAMPSDAPSEMPSYAPSEMPSAMPSLVTTNVPSGSMLPSAVPTTPSPTQDLISILSTVSRDDGDALEDSSAPQHKAYEWLANDPNLNSYSDEKKIQRYVLATFYFSTNGDDWTNNTGWLSYEDECDWFVSEGSLCSNGVVDDLDFYDGDGNNVSGSIPPELGLLSNLVDELDFSFNRLSGTIPSELGQLNRMRTLGLSGNELTGSIPTEVGLATNLSWMSMSRNALTGPIPSEIGQLTKLTKLYLYSTQLTGTIPTEIRGLTILDLLWLYNTSITGDFICPDSITDCRISCDDASNDTCRSL